MHPNYKTWLIVVWFACFTAAICRADELRMTAKSLFEKSTVCDVRLTADGTGIELDAGELFEDDGPAAGYSYLPNEERLSGNVWVRKELVISRPTAGRATLLVAPGGNLQAIINGTPCPLERAGKAGDYWEIYSVPAHSFRAGSNEIVLHGTGKVWIARDDERATGSIEHGPPPNRSARSSDGGKTWDDTRLGPQGNIDGEYYVRVFLEHYRLHGMVLSPIFDAGNLSGAPISLPLAEVGPIRCDVDVDDNRAGDISLKIRSGTTLTISKQTWSDWMPITTGSSLVTPKGRYFQFDLQLTSDNPLQSPTVRQIRVEAAPRFAGDWTKRLRLLDAHNEHIVRTCIPCQYEPFDDPRLAALRRNYQLDDVVRGAASEFEIITRLARWSAGRWERGHLKEGYPPWNALDILRPHADGTPVGGFCQQYNVVFLQACESFGLVGRAVSIGAGDFGSKIRGGGHEVVEIWSNEFHKWIYVDGNFAWYAKDAASKVPLSLWELRKRQLQILQGKSPPATEIIHLAETGRKWTGLDAWPPFVELRMIPRSNFLEQKSPLPLNQGMRGWFWTGHYVWTDADAPAAQLYGHRVSHRANFEWTLNQVHYELDATATPGELRVHLETNTPGFDAFSAKTDDGTPAAATSPVSWKLHSGRNRLEIRSRNSTGREGPASWIEVEFQ